MLRPTCKQITRQPDKGYKERPLCGAGVEMVCWDTVWEQKHLQGEQRGSRKASIMEVTLLRRNVKESPGSQAERKKGIQAVGDHVQN